jgi:hypothetical protein
MNICTPLLWYFLSAFCWHPYSSPKLNSGIFAENYEAGYTPCPFCFRFGISNAMNIKIMVLCGVLPAVWWPGISVLEDFSASVFSVKKWETNDRKSKVCTNLILHRQDKHVTANNATIEGLRFSVGSVQRSYPGDHRRHQGSLLSELKPGVQKNTRCLPVKT